MPRFVFAVLPSVRLRTSVTLSLRDASSRYVPSIRSRPVPLFPVRVVGGILTQFVKAQYSVSRDGRFLMNEPVEGSASVPITLILNWSVRR